MIGAAAETIVLEIRDALSSRIRAQGGAPPSALIGGSKPSLAHSAELDAHKQQMTRDLKESDDSFWQAFFAQLRMTRNDAGHPTSVDPATLPLLVAKKNNPAQFGFDCVEWNSC
jgi:hypothetical protein